MGKFWTKYATIVQSVIGTTLLLSMLFGVYLELAFADHNEAPHKDAAPKNEVILLTMQINRILGTMDKNKEISAIVQKQNELDHERQDKKLDRILDKLEN